MKRRKGTDLKVGHYESPMLEIVMEAMRDDCVDMATGAHIVCG
jgi:hypothetical protein